MSFMADFPVEDGGRYGVEAVVVGNTAGVMVTSEPTTPHIKSAYYELVASTPFDATELMVSVVKNQAKMTRLLDIAVGPAGSEVDIIPNIFGDYPDPDTAPYSGIRFSVQIPAGSRISARLQSNQSNKMIHVHLHLIARGFAPSTPLGRVTAYGVNLSTSDVVLLDPGPIDHTKGAWIEVDPSTANDMKMLNLILGSNQNSLGGPRWLIDIGMGPAGSELVLIGDLGTAGIGAEKNTVSPAYYDGLPVNIR